VLARPAPLGVHRTPRGHVFRVRSAAARQILLALHEPGHERPFAEVGLPPEQRGDDDVWELELGGLPERFEYHYRVDDGPWLIDPYARALAGGEVWGDRSYVARGRLHRSYRALHRSPTPRTDRPQRPRIREGDRLIYELHLRGFTRHASSRVEHPGTYLGLVEKIPYLRDLGVTTVELLPIFEFDETDNRRRNPATGEWLLNSWGYMPLSFFAPKAGYAATGGGGREVDELVLLVDELHRAGLELVLDVVFNHTGESFGPQAERERLVSLAGLDRAAYFLADPSTGEPLDLTGCGNTLRLEHPATRRLVLDALRYWSGEIGVDGFRFDLAGAFFRGARGEPIEHSPLVEEIAADPLLAESLLIAEPWDVTGRAVERLLPPPWRVWNGPFRDEVRRVVRGERPARARLASHLSAAGDPLPEGARSAVDFVTCHDGFTLADLVSYEAKRNLANGEEDRDGWGDNLAWNCGVEGPSEEPAIVALRARQRRNFLALLLLARGTPMLLAGDELSRTQLGNNNAWCQDNEISWLDWSLTGSAGDLRPFLKRLRRLRAQWLRAPAAWRLASLEPAVVLELGADSAGAPELLLLVNPSERRIGFACAELGFERGRLRIDTATEEPGGDAVPIERFGLEPWSLVLVEPAARGARES